MTELINGATYRYSERGELRAYRGRVGVASGIKLFGKEPACTLSNLKEWPADGLEGSIPVLARELELVAEPATPTVLACMASPYPRKQEPAFERRSEPAFEGEEEKLVEDIRQELTRRGYLVCVVGQRNAKGSGTTVGYPDMSFRCSDWPRGMACLIEIKNASGEMTREQKGLHKDGWSYEARSVAEVIECLMEFERDLMRLEKPSTACTYSSTGGKL